ATHHVSRRAVLVVPVVEPLDRTREQVGADVAEDCGIFMEGGVHGLAVPSAPTFDVPLHRLDDRVDLFYIGGSRGDGRRHVLDLALGHTGWHGRHHRLTDVEREARNEATWE